LVEDTSPWTISGMTLNIRKWCWYCLIKFCLFDMFFRWTDSPIPYNYSLNSHHFSRKRGGRQICHASTN
jgi:hypothetical protein